MPQFSKILVPTDFSANAAAAIRLAARVASEPGAELHVLHVERATPLRYVVREGMLGSNDTDAIIEEKARTDVLRRLGEGLAELADGITPTATAAAFGEPWREIIDYAEVHGVDLIVMGRRGITLADVMLGSVAERVIRHAPCPVLITRTSIG